MILVAPLSALEEALTLGPGPVISLLGPGNMIDTPSGVPPEQHLKLEIHDVTAADDGLTAPGAEHVAALIDFTRRWDQTAPLLIHCLAGISRSSAGAFIALCCLNPELPEDALARLLRARGPHVQPNALMTRLGDRLLKRRGRMVAAVEAMGAAVPDPGRLFELPARPDGNSL